MGTVETSFGPRLSGEKGERGRRRAAARQTGSPSRARAKRGVLIVEDEGIIALELEAIVESLGYRVTGIASTVAEAVQLDAETDPDVILMDVRLGRGGNGVDAAAEILARRRVPIIFCTAYAGDPQTLARVQSVRPAGIVSKPVGPRELGAAIAAALSRPAQD